MVELHLERLSRRNKEWECRECGERFSATSHPDEAACHGCRGPSMWELTDDEKDRLRGQLRDAEPGDRLVVSGVRLSQMHGTVTSTDDEAVRLDESTDDPLTIQISTLEASDPSGESNREGTITFVDRTPGAEVEPVERETVHINVAEQIHEAAEAAGIDPGDADVKMASMPEHGDLKLTLEGRPVDD